MKILYEEMTRNSRKAKIMSGMLALLIVDEAKNMFNGHIPNVKKEELVIEQDIRPDNVRMKAAGGLGNKLGNPDIQFMFNEYLRKEDLVTDEELTKLVYENYTALANLRCNKTKQSKKEFMG